MDLPEADTSREMSGMDHEIAAILREKYIKWNDLHRLSRRPGGFQSNEIRNRVWPKLLNIDRYSIPDYRQFINNHPDYSQVQCDIERSLWSYQHVLKWPDELLHRRRESLSNIIMAILSRNKELHYFQGLHDIVSVFLLVFQEDALTFAVAEHVCLHVFNVCLLKDFEIMKETMYVIMIIMKVGDNQLYSRLPSVNMEPFFAISWIITWFSHSVKGIQYISRIFDVMLCSPPYYSYYLAAAYVLLHRDSIMDLELDNATIHHNLSGLPSLEQFPFEDVLIYADNLLQSLPIEAVLRRRDVSKELKEMVTSGKLVLFNNIDYSGLVVPSDWTLLRNSHVVRRNNVDRIDWGWKTSKPSNVHMKNHKNKQQRKSYMKYVWILSVIGVVTVADIIMRNKLSSMYT